jgi:hypothetical protein
MIPCRHMLCFCLFLDDPRYCHWFYSGRWYLFHSLADACVEGRRCEESLIYKYCALLLSIPLWSASTFRSCFLILFRSSGLGSTHTMLIRRSKVLKLFFFILISVACGLCIFFSDLSRSAFWFALISIWRLFSSPLLLLCWGAYTRTLDLFDTDSHQGTGL